MKMLILAFGLALMMPWQVANAENSFQSSPTRVVLHKNGLAWVVEEGRGKADQEWVETELHGRPVVGTLRVSGRDDVEVVEILAAPAPANAADRKVEGLSRELVGRQLTVEAEGRNWAGKMVGISPAILGTEPMLVLEGKEGMIILPVARITRVDTGLGAGSLPAHLQSRDSAVRLRLSRKQGHFHLVASYMTAQIGWTPTYLLDLEEGDKGTLQLDALVVNDALDLAGAEVQFATGEAAFPLSHITSPLFEPGVTNGQIMDTVMGRVRGGLFDSGIDNNPVYQSSNYMPAQQMVRFGDTADSGRGGGEESHLYGPVELTLARGQRVILPIGRGTIPASSLYYYKAPLTVSNAPEANNVWLAARLTNKLSFPLTTGPVLVTRKGRPAGQGIITYTHEGGEALVPISTASSVLATTAEQENDRSGGALDFRGSKWDKVQIKGTMVVENLQEREVAVRLEKSVSGKFERLSHEGAGSERMASAWDPNPQSTARWTIQAPPGKKVEVTYNYVCYVQSIGKASSW